jgi:hypothetical protein
MTINRRIWKVGIKEKSLKAEYVKGGRKIKWNSR